LSRVRPAAALGLSLLTTAPQSAPAPAADVRWVDLARVVLVIGAIGLAGAGLRLPAVVSLLAAWIGPRLLRGRN
ncbi:MAG: hypothetical protein ACREMG_00585, partial [Gemmatimonadales bacterium]